MALTDNLVGYWKFDDQFPDFGASDSHGSHDASIEGVSDGINSVAGKLGDCAEIFDESYFEVPHHSNFAPGNTSFAWAGWVWLDSKAADRTVVSKGIFNYCEYALQYDSGTDRFIFFLHDLDTELLLTVSANNFGSPSVDAWYFVVCWHDADGNTVNIKVNNGTTNSASTSGLFLSPAGEPVNFGGLGGSPDYVGRLDSFGFWKRVLTSDEMTELYGSGDGLDYPFDGGEEAEQATVWELSAQGNGSTIWRLTPVYD